MYLTNIGGVPAKRISYNVILRCCLFTGGLLYLFSCRCSTCEATEVTTSSPVCWWPVTIAFPRWRFCSITNFCAATALSRWTARASLRSTHQTWRRWPSSGSTSMVREIISQIHYPILITCNPHVFTYQHGIYCYKSCGLLSQLYLLLTLKS